MSSAVVAYLLQRPDAATFLLPSDLARTLQDLFPRTETLLPQPYKIFPADETQQPALGFPVAESSVMKELEQRLERWLADEVAWQVGRQPEMREKAQLSFTAYLTPLMKTAENALMSNLLNDYHAVFWLAHSFDVARHFSTLPRRISAIDTQAGRTQGDALKYRIFSRWFSDTREQMTQLAARAASILDGEEQRGLQFFRLLQDDVLILTEEFIGPDLRELRSFVTGYLRRDFQAFRDGFEKLRTTASDLLQKDRTLRSALALFGANPDHGITTALLLDSRFQAFLFDHPAVQNASTREDREQFQLIAKRVREFAVLNQLRRGIVWMASTPDGQIISADRRTLSRFSRSTRPLDFGKAGVVDPMIHRFGLIYDISAFSETLGNIRRGGGKEEVRSYRQMLLFQRKLETIADRNLLQFEKFLGDGAFYTTRRALRLTRASVEIQRFYSEMKRKGFAFNKGLRIALNYGYYRLLPMKTSTETDERITEFYGPGIVELSRLTTGKANKEIEEIASFLVAHGYDQARVQTFFAPLARGVDVIDHTQHAREFYAYVNASGHLVNEGIVASMAFLQELSAELTQEQQRLYRLRSAWGSYIGFAPAVPGLEYVGLRLLGMVSLKGLDDIEVGEIAPFAPGEVEATPLESHETLVVALRHEFHRDEDAAAADPSRMNTDSVPVATEFTDLHDTTTERMIAMELIVCAPPENGNGHGSLDVVIGEWDPRSDAVHHAIRLPRHDFDKLFPLAGALSPERLSDRRAELREIYQQLSSRATTAPPPLVLADLREIEKYETWVVGDEVEKL
ncbi:MAG TPA: hypothetical protein VF698_12730 [Thermoanaerobaculia bacterium]